MVQRGSWRYNQNKEEKEEKGWVYLNARSTKNAGDVHVYGIPIF